MMRIFFEKIDPFIVLCFELHDFASDFLAKHLFLIKRTLLIVAHLSLFGIFFPEFRKGFGSVAASVLIAILFLSPLSRIFRTRLLLQMMGVRRELGILMGYLVLVHGVSYFIDPQWVAIFIAPSGMAGIFAIPPYLLFGFLAFILTLPLLITSNDLALKLLGGKDWKFLHRIVYALFVAAILHRFLVRGANGADNIDGIIQAAILIFSYAFAKLLAWKNFIAPLRDIITSVSERYQVYALAKKEKNLETTSL